MILTVTESPGETMVYDVQSASRPARTYRTYRVDLLANSGGIRCACRDHSIRRQPAIDDGKPLLTRATTCKHGWAALRHFNLGLLARMANAEDVDR